VGDEGREPEGAPERSPKAGAGAPSGVAGNGPKRFSVQRKLAIVARLLRGEPLDLVVRQANVSVARLTEWRDRALAESPDAPQDRQWMWASSHNGDICLAAHGYEPTREAAMAAFAKSW
jgi:hypothetical protein